MRAAFVTGGSSGIGLAAARQLAATGRDIAIFARDPAKLDAARATILAQSPDIRVEVFAVDVADTKALVAAIRQAVDRLGAPDRAVASAGIAIPGFFEDQDSALHHRHMDVNYFGALHFVRALIDPMTKAGGGRIGLIASGAAFFGICGYSAYAPTKFALRGLAEILRIELEDREIGVTLVYPPDTDTPQLAEENKTKPKATKAITAGGGLWQPHDVARHLLTGMERNRATVTLGLQMRLLLHLTGLLAPALRLYQRRVLRRSGR